MQKSTVVHTTASPFKVTPIDSNQFEIIEVNQPMSKSSRMLDSAKKNTKCTYIPNKVSKLISF